METLVERLARYEAALLAIEELVFGDQTIPLKIREAIQYQVIVKAGVNPPPKRQSNL